MQPHNSTAGLLSLLVCYTHFNHFDRRLQGNRITEEIIAVHLDYMEHTALEMIYFLNMFFCFVHLSHDLQAHFP